jgi:hypothetical protein
MANEAKAYQNKQQGAHAAHAGTHDRLLNKLDATDHLTKRGGGVATHGPDYKNHIVSHGKRSAEAIIDGENVMPGQKHPGPRNRK